MPWGARPRLRPGVGMHAAPIGLQPFQCPCMVLLASLPQAGLLGLPPRPQQPIIIPIVDIYHPLANLTTDHRIPS